LALWLHLVLQNKIVIKSPKCSKYLNKTVRIVFSKL
jgi:hypothetical protein